MDEPILKTIVALLGGGGVTAIILGILGFLRGRPQKEAASNGMMFAPDRSAIERLASALERNAAAIDRQTDVQRDHTDAIQERTREMKRR